MPEENIERLRRGYEHVGRTMQLLPEITHPDFVWDTTKFRGGMLMNEVVGVEATNRWMAEWTEGFDDWSVEVAEFIDAGDRVLAIVDQRAVARHGGPEVEMRIFQVWTFSDGLVTRMDMYADRAEAFRDAGLPDPEES